MTALDPALDPDRWTARLQAAVAAHAVPGAQLGIALAGHDPVVVTAGVLDVRSGEPVRPDSVFQIGSITKPWTAALALQQVEAGRVTLDQPVRDVLPDLATGDESAAATMTLRHLLSHRSGLDGDIFRETGDGPDAVARYVESLRTASQVAPVGTDFSYSNAGYVVAGRVAEVCAGRSWATLVPERLAEPLGLTDVHVDEASARAGSHAVGHVIEDGRAVVAEPWAIPAGMGPAGAIATSARSVLAFADVFLRDSAATRILTPEAVAESVEPTQPIDLAGVTGWGAGWMRADLPHARIWGHDGGTNGQHSALRVHPDHGLSVVVLTNGGHGVALHRELVPEVARVVAGVQPPPAPMPAAAWTGSETDRLVGRWMDGGTELVVERTPAGVVAAVRPRTTLNGAPVDAPLARAPLRRVRPGRGIWRRPGETTWTVVELPRDPSVGDHLHLGLRRLVRS